MAEAFIPNPNNYPIINHKDNNPSNNFVYINEDGSVNLEKSNLEWCSYEYNNNYGTRNIKLAKTLTGRHISIETKKKLSKANSRPVLQIDKNTNEVIAEFPSASEVQRQSGYYQAHISKCCNNEPNHNTAYGYKWKYA